MADRTVSVELLAKLSGYTSSTEAAAASTNSLADAMVRAAGAQKTLEGAQKQAASASAAAAKAAAANASAQRKQLDALTTVGKGFLTFGAVAGVGFGLAVKASLEFNKQMALVGTLAKVQGAPLIALSNAALTVGQKFGYTASQVATAEAELIKAGLNTKQVLGGALTGALTLAAAAQTDVATATELTVSAMTQFGLKAGSVPHIADLLAAGADKALGSAVDLGQGLTQVGTTAHQFGFSIDETVGVLAAFAEQGQIGSRAGTELNQALLQLAAPTTQAQTAMTKYGISLYDGSGNIKTFAQLAGNLQTAFKGVSAEQRNSALATIFGSRAIRAANILYDQGAAGITAWVSKVNDAGFAAQQASGKLDSLSGDLTKLKAAFETGLIKTGDEATGALRGLVQGLTEVVNLYDNASPVIKTFIFDATATATVFGVVGGAALIAVPKVLAFREALAALRATAASTAITLDAEAASETAAGTAGAAGAGRGLLGRAAGAAGVAGPVGLVAAGLLVATGTAISADQQERAGEVHQAATNPATLAADRKRLADLQRQAATPNRTPIRFGGTNNAGTGAEIKRLTGIINDATKAQNENAQAEVAGAKSTDTWVNSYQAVNGVLVTTSLDLNTLTSDLTTLGHAFDVQGATDKLTEGFKALGKQIDKNGASTKGNSAAALANRDALRQQYNNALDIISAYVAQGHTADEVKSKTSAVTKQFITQATQAGLTKGQIQQYINKLHQVPAVVNSNVNVNGLTPAISRVLALTAYLNAIKGKRFEVQVAAQVNFEGGANLPGFGVLAPTTPVKKKKAHGGLLDGPGTGTSDSILMRGSKGEFMVNARATAATLPLLEHINSSIPAFASGGIIGGGTANLSDIFSLLGSTSASDAKTSLQRADSALAGAEATLAKLRRSGKASVDDLRAAEARVAADRSTRAKAAASYSTARQPLANQFAADTLRTVTADGAFIANLNKLAAKGFGFLANQLLSQGDSQAKTIAAKAVGWSNSRLSSLQGSLSKSAAQQTTLGLLPAELAISSALKTGKNPTLSSIAAATGLDPSDLQAGLIALQSSLKGNKNAGALLSGLNSTGVYSQSSWGATTAAAGPQFTVVIPKASKNPYSTGEKIAMGANRVLATSSGNQSMPRW